MLYAACQAFHDHGFAIQAFDSAIGVLGILAPSWPGIVIADARMPAKAGLGLVRDIHQRHAELPVIVLAGQGDVAMAIEAILAGAYDVIEKPFDAAKLVPTASRALKRRRVVLETRKRNLHTAGRDSGRMPPVERLPRFLRRFLAFSGPHILSSMLRPGKGCGCV